MTKSQIAAEYDVVVVGGGPVGLLLAYQLKRFGVQAAVFERYTKETQENYGRAIALFPRTVEQLDQLDLAEMMLQLGFACRSSVTYKEGQRVIPGRVWTFMENIKDTVYDFALVLRQMYSERIIREEMDTLDAPYYQGIECTDFVIDESENAGENPILSTFVNADTKETFQVRRQAIILSGRQAVLCSVCRIFMTNSYNCSKYLIGADGGRSFVRKNAGIPFDGDTSEDSWIRIDGIVKTDMPITRAYGAIESKTHGNVLWAPLDHGGTRIGYAYSAEIAAKYPGGVTREIAVKEAIECMKPFKLEFKEVHWWTHYTIGQRIAREFSTKDRIFLCGDAAHTHSSGAAQGLNTGIHDAVNLGWKLALHTRGITKADVLKTYATERMTAVKRLIGYDKDISVLMSHQWPSWYKGDPEADPYILLGEIFEKAASFNTGLGISYPLNLLNKESAVKLGVVPGARPPDIDLTMPGTNRAIRYQRITRNLAKFHVVIYAGKIEATGESLLALQKFLQMSGAELATNKAISWITISCTLGCSPYEALGMKPFGSTYFDPTTFAHDKIGISTETGGAVILRPDGLVGSAGPIDGPWIWEYFRSILVE